VVQLLGFLVGAEISWFVDLDGIEGWNQEFQQDPEKEC
jgi:hypothetical protein